MSQCASGNSSILPSNPTNFCSGQNPGTIQRLPEVVAPAPAPMMCRALRVSLYGGR